MWSYFAVPRGEYLVYTLARVRISIALLVRLGCEILQPVVPMQQLLGGEHSCTSSVAIRLSIAVQDQDTAF